MSQHTWQALDSDGNVIDSWAGPQKISRIGNEWKGTMVDSIVQVIEPTREQILEQRIVDLEARVTAMEVGDGT